jgi:hypothetical protein
MIAIYLMSEPPLNVGDFRLSKIQSSIVYGNCFRGLWYGNFGKKEIAGSLGKFFLLKLKSSLKFMNASKKQSESIPGPPKTLIVTSPNPTEGHNGA